MIDACACSSSIVQTIAFVSLSTPATHLAGPEPIASPQLSDPFTALLLPTMINFRLVWTSVFAYALCAVAQTTLLKSQWLGGLNLAGFEFQIGTKGELQSDRGVSRSVVIWSANDDNVDSMQRRENSRSRRSSTLQSRVSMCSAYLCELLPTPSSG